MPKIDPLLWDQIILKKDIRTINGENTSLFFFNGSAKVGYTQEKNKDHQPLLYMILKN